MASPIRVCLPCPKVGKNRRFVRVGDRHTARPAGAGRRVGVSRSVGCGVRPGPDLRRCPRPGGVLDLLGGFAYVDGTGRLPPAAIVAIPGRAIRSSLPRCFLLRHPENPASPHPDHKYVKSARCQCCGQGESANGVRMGSTNQNIKLINYIKE